MLHLAVIGTTEWLLIGAVVMLLFGARKLPELARAMGSSVNEFKKGMASDGKEGERADQGGPSSTSGPTKDH
jgi:sec-independent protein translocase protein TatA